MQTFAFYLGIFLIVIITLAWSIRYKIKPYFVKKQLYQQMLTEPNGTQYALTYNLFKTLYANIDGQRFSHKARSRLKITSQEFVYGEIEFMSFIDIIKKQDIRQGDIFYDLGSGTGKAVFAAALCFDFAKCCGIEILTELHEIEVAQLDRARNLITVHKKSIADAYLNKIARIQFINANILACDFYDATLVFINATCFYPETWNSVETKLALLKPGARVIVTTKSIFSAKFKLLSRENILMSWGMNSISIYEKID